MNLDIIVQNIIQNPLFVKLREIVENNPWHDYESVYDHSIKTKDIALREISGDFISNPEAKELFLKYVNEDFHGMKRKDLMMLIALLHDIGKILSVKEGNRTHPILITDAGGNTLCPGHEYWGSTIVSKVLYGISLESDMAAYISRGIRVHDAFQGDYLPPKKDWPIEAIINDVKSRAEGLYIESMFNNFCDVFSAAPFQPYKELVIRIFNEPLLYVKREYVIP